MKVLTSNNSIVFVYLVQKRAIAFEFDGRLYPSVYLLWKYGNIILSFTTNSFVISKIVNGADLMLPGIIRHPNGYGVFHEKTLASINSNNNKAPIAVGITAISSSDLDAVDPKGKCVIIYHTYGDKLCSLEDMPVTPIIELGPPEWLAYSIESTNDFPVLGDNIEPSSINSPELNQMTDQETNEEKEVPNEMPTESVQINETEEMDKILVQCFLTAIKYSKTLQLPMLTSSFYKLAVMPLCPADKTLDIKKSSFKKVGQFLKHMEKVQYIILNV